MSIDNLERAVEHKLEKQERTLRDLLQDLYRDNHIHFAWNYSHDGWECVGEQITERGQDQLVSHYITADSSFYSEALIDAEERARACIDDGDALALGFLIRDSLRRQAVEWAQHSGDWGWLRDEDLANEKSRYPQAEGY